MNYKKIFPFLAAVVISCSPGTCYNKLENVEKPPIAGAKKVLSPLEEEALNIGKMAKQLAVYVKVVSNCETIDKKIECQIPFKSSDKEKIIFEKIVYKKDGFEIYSGLKNSDKIILMNSAMED